MLPRIEIISLVFNFALFITETGIGLVTIFISKKTIGAGRKSEIIIIIPYRIDAIFINGKLDLEICKEDMPVAVRKRLLTIVLPKSERILRKITLESPFQIDIYNSFYF